MIISAIYRTDIPAFYGEWFMNRLEAGYCLVANPYSNRPYRANLLREDVDGIVFWTKNMGPFMDKLPVVKARGYPFIVQYTITGYPRELEYSVVDDKRSVQHMHMIAEMYGPRVAVWRYDPIVFTSVLTVDFHRENFARLAKALAGTTDEAVISFAQLHKKTYRNLNLAAKRFGFQWSDPPDAVKHALAAEMATIARSHGMQVTMCGQREYVTETIPDAHCVDAQRMIDVAGEPLKIQAKAHRAGCGCFASRDIGAYDTCPHGCVYCYAVQNRDLARKRYKEHDPKSEYLYITGDYVEPENIREHNQLKLL